MTDLDQLAKQYLERGYSAAHGQLYTPSGYAVGSVIRDGSNVYLAAQLAQCIEDMQRSALDRGKRNLRGMILHTQPTSAF